MPGVSQGGGGLANVVFSLLLEIGRSNLNTKVYILIKEISTNIFCQVEQNFLTTFLFSLLLKIGPSNTNTNIFILIKYFFVFSQI